MRKCILLAVLLCMVFTARAQFHLEAAGGLGAAYYKRYWENSSEAANVHPIFSFNLGLNALYAIPITANSEISVLGGMNVVRLGGILDNQKELTDSDNKEGVFHGVDVGYALRMPVGANFTISASSAVKVVFAGYLQLELLLTGQSHITHNFNSNAQGDYVETTVDKEWEFTERVSSSDFSQYFFHRAGLSIGSYGGIELFNHFGIGFYIDNGLTNMVNQEKYEEEIKTNWPTKFMFQDAGLRLSYRIL